MVSVAWLEPAARPGQAATVARVPQVGCWRIPDRLECRRYLRLWAAPVGRAARERNAARMMLQEVSAGGRIHAQAEVMAAAVVTEWACRAKVNQARRAATVDESPKVATKMAAPAAEVAQEFRLNKEAVAEVMVETPGTSQAQRPASTVHHFAQVAVAAEHTVKLMPLEPREGEARME